MDYNTVGKRLIIEPINIDNNGLIGGNEIKIYKVLAVGDNVVNIKKDDNVILNSRNVLEFRFNNQKFYVTNEESVLLYGKDFK